jgi:site-specific DNA recombinase
MDRAWHHAWIPEISPSALAEEAKKTHWLMSAERERNARPVRAISPILNRLKGVEKIMVTTKRRVGLYTRLSTDEQSKEGYSLGAQQLACREYLDRLYGPEDYTIELFSDEGLSPKLGFLPDHGPKLRPGLVALAEAIDKSHLDTVITWRLDRLSDDGRVWSDFLQDYVLKRQVDFILVNENLDPTTPMGRFTAGVLALSAELFAESTTQNVQESMKRRGEAGYSTGEGRKETI